MLAVSPCAAELNATAGGRSCERERQSANGRASELPNRIGMELGSATSDNRVGGTLGTTPGGNCTGACNLISGNTENGIDVQINRSDFQNCAMGRLGCIKTILSRRGVEGDRVKTILNQIKEALFSSLEPCQIEPRYYQVLKALAHCLSD